MSPEELRPAEGEDQEDSGAGKSRLAGLSRRAQVLLTTVGTLVAIITGMVALTGKIGSGHAEAEDSLPEYQQKVGEVCDEVNDHEQDRAVNARLMAKRVARAQTTLEERNVVQDGTQQDILESEHDFALLDRLSVPRSLADTEGIAVAAWTRKLDRWREFVHGLDVATSTATVFAAADAWGAVGVARHRDDTTQRSALLELGGPRCRLDEPVKIKSIRLTWVEPGETKDSIAAKARRKAKDKGDSGTNQGATDTDRLSVDATSRQSSGVTSSSSAQMAPGRRTSPDVSADSVEQPPGDTTPDTTPNVTAAPRGEDSGLTVPAPSGVGPGTAGSSVEDPG